MHRLLAALHQGDGLMAIGGFHGLVAVALEDGNGEAPHGLLVFHHQNARPGVLTVNRLGGTALRLQVTLNPGQIDLKHGALAGGAIDGDPALVLGHQAVDGGQAQPGGGGAVLCSEEGLEEMAARGLVDARAGIGDGQHDVGAGVGVGMAFHVGVVYRGIGGANRQLATSGKGLHGIPHQVHQSIAHLPGIHGHQSRGRIQFQAQRDAGAQKGHPGAPAALHHRIEMHHPRADNLFAAKGQELLSEVGRPFPSLADGVHLLAGRIGFVEIACQQAGIAVDDRQQVVEFVRHASGQNPDSLQPAALANRRLRRLAACDIAVGAVDQLLAGEGCAAGADLHFAH